MSQNEQSPEKTNLPPTANFLSLTFFIIQHRYGTSNAVPPFSSRLITSFTSSKYLHEGQGGQCFPNEKFCMVLPPKESLTWRFAMENMIFGLPKCLHRQFSPPQGMFSSYVLDLHSIVLSSGQLFLQILLFFIRTIL